MLKMKPSNEIQRLAYIVCRVPGQELHNHLTMQAARQPVHATQTALECMHQRA